MTATAHEFQRLFFRHINRHPIKNEVEAELRESEAQPGETEEYLDFIVTERYKHRHTGLQRPPHEDNPNHEQ